MAIRVICGACQKSLNVKDEYSGRTAKCPQCGGTIKIPTVSKSEATSVNPQQTTAVSPKNKPAVTKTVDRDVDPPFQRPVTASSDPNQLMREILMGFQGEFPRVVPTIGYRLAALFVATFMILLPVVYVLFVASFGYLVYWHATENHTILKAARGFRTGKGAAFLYFGPLFVGTLLILFLIKPLFARPGKQQQDVVVSLADEPLLHSFVQRLCDAVNSPRPSLIEVNCDVNAAAFFRNGWWGFLRNDMGLQIGLPLLSALDTRQFAGVLAHELGHFSQGAGMRLSYIIRSVNMWFNRVIYERDSWDEWLTSLSEGESGGITILVALTSLCIWLSRRVLWVLMVIGHVVCCFLLRQMEYDADKYEARLAGSEVFESTMRRITELSLADMVTRQILAANFARAGLPDNLPLCLSRVSRKLPSEIAEIANEMIETQRTSLLASHPASRDRIAAAHRQKADGIFRLERPAKVLLKDYTRLAGKATLLTYKRMIGKTAAKQQMTSTDTYLAQVESDQRLKGVE